ncbi:MAG: hypothetical protein ACOCRK_09145 [bacterium]
MIKILILGRVKGAYRTQDIYKYLFNNRENYRFISYDPDWVYLKNNNIIIRYISRLIFYYFINTIMLFILISFTNKVFIPAMNHSNAPFIFIAKLLGKEVITDLYISLYDTNVFDRKKINKDSWQARKIKLYDKILLKYSDIVIHLNEYELKYIAKLLSLDINKIRYVIIPLSNNEKKKKIRYTVNKKINICWWGSYIPLHGLDKIIKMADYLKEKIDFHIYLCGNSAEKSREYQRLIDNSSLNKIITIRNDITFSNGKLEEFLINNCDLSLGVFGNSIKAHNVLTNKVVDSINMKIPVLTMEKEALYEFFDTSNDIYTCNNDPQDMAEKVIGIFNKTTAIERNRRAEKAYEIYLNYFTIGKFHKELEEIFSD